MQFYARNNHVIFCVNVGALGGAGAIDLSACNGSRARPRRDPRRWRSAKVAWPKRAAERLASAPGSVGQGGAGAQLAVEQDMLRGIEALEHKIEQAFAAGQANLVVRNLHGG